jgi:TRAP-type uncharacterized transport system fused permease subunit
MFVYSPLLIMRGPWLEILLAVALCFLGILMGTMAVVGFFRTRIPALFRVAYGAVALMLLAQPAMFAGARWTNLAGVLLAAAGIACEVMRGRPQPQTT